MLQRLLHTFPTRRLAWLLTGLLWLASPWLAHAQTTTSPFEVRVTPSTSPVTLTAGGTVPLSASAVYPAFIRGINGNVNAIAVQADGKIVVGGTFTQYTPSTGSSIALPCIARLRPDGSLDASFTPTGFTTMTTVYTIAVQANGDIVVGGSFAFTSNGTHTNIARLKATDGSFDANFGYATGSGFDNPVRALAIQPDGRIVVGGEFSKFTTATQPSTTVTCNRLVRLKADGTYDANDLFSRGFNNFVYCLLLQPDNRVLVGGAFTTYWPSSTSPSTRNRLACLNTDGSLDTSYAAAASGGPTDGVVLALARQPDGKVLVGGNYVTYGGPRAALARVDVSGNLDTTFPVIATASTSGGSVTDIVVQANGTAVAGGQAITFTTGTTTNLFRFALTGAATGIPESTFNTSNFFTNTLVTAVALQPNGQLLVGSGSTASKSLVCLNASDGSVNTADTPVPGATYAWSNGSTGPALAVVASGTYTATATSQGFSATSNAVVVNGAPTATYAVRVTPAGPMRICPGSSQVLTAQAVSTTAAPLPTPLSYRWLQVVGGTTTVVSTNSTYTVPAGAAGTVRYYVATATNNTTVAASPTLLVAVMPPPTVSFASGTPSSGAPGEVITLVCNSADAVTSVLFGKQAASFTLTSSTELRVVVPGISYKHRVTVQTPCTRDSTSTTYTIKPSITSFSPQAGPAGTVITVTGTGFIAPLAATFGTSSGGTVTAPLTAVSSTQFTVVVPATAATGTLSVTAATGGASSATAFVVVNGPSTTVTPSAPTLPLASYTNVVVASGATLNLTQNVTISGQFIVRSGATLNTGLFQVTGSGGLVLEAGATLTTAHAQGFSTSPATGAIVLTGTRRYATDASYGYTGTTQVTGNGLPNQVRSLRCASATSLTLTNPVAVAQVLTLAGTGNFILNNQPLTLLSGPGGTALVHNQGSGVVVGAATIQRYIDPTVNPTTGFRYYGAPVRGATAAVFPASAFAYDETRVTSSFRRDTTAAINAGFVPTALLPSTGLEPGRGYRAAVPATTTVSFVGTLNTDTLSLRLTRSLPAGYSGWHLVSNPYPSPLDWSLVDSTDRPGLDAAIYIYESTGPGTGYFRSYVNGAGAGSPLIAAGQAFFVRVSGSTPGGTGRLRFRNSQRITTFDNATQPVFNRTQLTVTLPELVIEMERNGGCHPCRLAGTSATQTPVPAELNSIAVYTDPAATPGFDRLLDADAGNLFSPVQQTLGIRSSGPDTLAVQALPTLNPAVTTEVPLTLSATAPGDYTFTASLVGSTTWLNGTSAYLRDASVTPNRYTALVNGTVVPFALSAADLLTQPRPTRFYLYFGPPRPLATAAGAALQSATVYPNPTHERIGVQVPAVPGASVVQATLLNTLGQVLLRHTAALPATGATLSLPVPGLASGVYILRLQAGDTITTRRVVLE